MSNTETSGNRPVCSRSGELSGLRLPPPNLQLAAMSACPSSSLDCNSSKLAITSWAYRVVWTWRLVPRCMGPQNS